MGMDSRQPLEGGLRITEPAFPLFPGPGAAETFSLQGLTTIRRRGVYPKRMSFGRSSGSGMKSSNEERSPFGIAAIAALLAILANLIVVVQFVGQAGSTPAPESTAKPLPPEPPPDPAGVVYRTPSGEKYHRATCSYVKGKAIRLTPKEAKELGLSPCKICHPPPLP